MEKVMSDTHPCYSENAGNYARMHIPVAPVCNISCNYCNRKYDCLHETRPGVTSEILSPEQSLEKYKMVREKVSNLSVIGIAGPGDALANFNEVKESIRLIKKEDPELIFCLSTNGLNLPEYAEELVKLGVSHVTITINTIDPAIGAGIYKYINYRGKYYFGEKAAQLLLYNQLSGLKYLSKKGVQCKVNVVMIKDINESHIPVVVDKVKELGAVMTNIMPLIPAEGSKFADMPLVSKKELNHLRNKCSKILKQMYHCRQCRADAIGQLNQDRSAEFRSCAGSKLAGKIESINKEIKKDKELMKTNDKSYTEKVSLGETKKYYFAIATRSGNIIDQHFGHVDKFAIYQYSSNGIEFVEDRKVIKYCDGGECSDMKSKIDNIIELLADCTAILSVRIGPEPGKRLEEAGIKTLNMYGKIEDGIKSAVEKLDLTLESII